MLLLLRRRKAFLFWLQGMRGVSGRGDAAVRELEGIIETLRCGRVAFVVIDTVLEYSCSPGTRDLPAEEKGRGHAQVAHLGLPENWCHPSRTKFNEC